jgi:hypothetical protein
MGWYLVMSAPFAAASHRRLALLNADLCRRRFAVAAVRAVGGQAEASEAQPQLAPGLRSHGFKNLERNDPQNASRRCRMSTVEPTGSLQLVNDRVHRKDRQNVRTILRQIKQLTVGEIAHWRGNTPASNMPNVASLPPVFNAFAKSRMLTVPCAPGQISNRFVFAIANRRW